LPLYTQDMNNYETMLAADPANCEARVMLRYYFAKNAEALNQWPAAFLQYTNALNHLPAASSYLEQISHITINRSFLHSQCVLSLIEQSKLASALAYLQTMSSEITTENGEYLLKTLREKIHKRELNIQSYTQSLQNPDNNVFFYLRGEAYSNLDMYEQAIADLNHFLNTVPDDLEAIYLRAECYSALQQPEWAIKDYNNYLQWVPNDTNSLLKIATAFDTLAQTEKALDICNTLIASRASTKTYLLRGNIFFNLKNYAKAAEDFTAYANSLKNSFGSPAAISDETELKLAICRIIQGHYQILDLQKINVHVEKMKCDTAYPKEHLKACLRPILSSQDAPLLIEAGLLFLNFGDTHIAQQIKVSLMQLFDRQAIQEKDIPKWQTFLKQLQACNRYNGLFDQTHSARAMKADLEIYIANSARPK